MILVLTVMLSAQAAPALGLDPVAPTVGVRLGDGVRLDARVGPVLAFRASAWEFETSMPFSPGSSTEARDTTWGSRAVLAVRAPLLSPSERSARLDLVIGGTAEVSWTRHGVPEDIADDRGSRTRSLAIGGELGLGAELPLDDRRRWTVGLDGLLLPFHHWSTKSDGIFQGFPFSTASTRTDIALDGRLRLLVHVRLGRDPSSP